MLDDRDEFERSCLVESVRGGWVSLETAQSFINELKRLQQENSLNSGWDEILATIAPQNLEGAINVWLLERQKHQAIESHWWLIVGSFV